jgi:23S rRNA pseudouridine1911/1915/1917 synthase
MTTPEKRTLLDWLCAKFPDTPRKRAKQWILAGRVSVNRVVIRRPQEILPAPAATLTLLEHIATTMACGPTGIVIHPRVTLLHLDHFLAIVNKGPGILSVPAKDDDVTALGVLADYLTGKLHTDQPAPAAYRQLKPLPVHRLDQFTSGVFCLAMNPAARANLIDQLASQTMRRHYIAYVEGRPAKQQGTWRNWLILSENGLQQRIVPNAEPGAIQAITHYEVVETFARAVKIRLRLETGRKHQIRVQAAHAGLPLIGDRTYHPDYRGFFPRQALHAETLTLQHPDQPGAVLSWTAALPADLAKLEAKLKLGKRG